MSGRLVDVTPGWMLAAGQVVELVAEVSVARTGEEVEDDADESDGQDDGRSGDNRIASELRGRDD